MQLIPIEKIFSNRDSIRKAREAFLIQKGRTIDPHGLLEAHSFLELRSRKAVRSSEQIITADKYPSLLYRHECFAGKSTTR